MTVKQAKAESSSSEDEDFDNRLPAVPQDSPQEERRPTVRYSPHEERRGVTNHMGRVATPLAAVALQNKRRSESDRSESLDRSRDSSSAKGSLDSIDLNETPAATVKPAVAPKPGKEKPPVAKVNYFHLSKLFFLFPFCLFFTLSLHKKSFYNTTKMLACQ